MQEADALNLVQEVFTTLVQKLPDFTYDSDKGFRNWLFTLMRHRHLNMSRRRPLPVDQRVHLSQVAGLADSSVRGGRPAAALLAQVLPAMRESCSSLPPGKMFCGSTSSRGGPPRKWPIGWESASAAVSKAKSRVLARLHEELADLLPDRADNPK